MSRFRAEKVQGNRIFNLACVPLCVCVCVGPTWVCLHGYLVMKSSPTWLLTMLGMWKVEAQTKSKIKRWKKAEEEKKEEKITFSWAPFILASQMLVPSVGSFPFSLMFLAFLSFCLVHLVIAFSPFQPVKKAARKKNHFSILWINKITIQTLLNRQHCIRSFSITSFFM